MQFDKLTPPTEGTRITLNSDGTLSIPTDPIIPYIRGDGIGIDITPVVRKVIDGIVKKAYNGERVLNWFKVYAGDEARDVYAPDITDSEFLALTPERQRELYLPNDTLNAFTHYLVGLKGPLTTPIGKGFRSLNVAIRQKLDLYACVRPVKHYKGVPTRVKHPEELNVVVFRENSEDVYSGIEFESNSKAAEKLIKFLKDEGAYVRDGSGIGIKPISEFGSKRLVEAAVKYAIERDLPSVTLVHKGNIQKFTEGAFSTWGYEVAKDMFAKNTITEDEVWEKFNGKTPDGKLMINDRIADIMFQHLLLRTKEFSVLATTNLNGDYLSDAAAAIGGGIGMAPGANINYQTGIGVFEATHGTAPKHAGKDKVNPGSLLLSSAMMLEYIGWDEASSLLKSALEKTIVQKQVTYDLARQMTDAQEISCSAFGDRILENC